MVVAVSLLESASASLNLEVHTVIKVFHALVVLLHQICFAFCQLLNQDLCRPYYHRLRLLSINFGGKMTFLLDFKNSLQLLSFLSPTPEARIQKIVQPDIKLRAEIESIPTRRQKI